MCLGGMGRGGRKKFVGKFDKEIGGWGNYCYNYKYKGSEIIPV